MHEGHRKRMLDRLKNASETFQDHELLEVLLYNAIPRKNTNEIAHRLIHSCGSLNAVFEASIELLTSVEGVGESTAIYLRCVGECMKRAKAQSKKQSPRVSNFSQFQGFIQEHYRELNAERIEIYAIDAKGGISFLRGFTSQEEERAYIAPGEICNLFAAFQPHSIIVAHNHVEGVAKPSAADDLFTKELQTVCSLYGIKLYDHVIVSPKETYSYFLTGRMVEIQEKYNVETIFGRE